MINDSTKYLHKIMYYKYRKEVIGIIPSLDKMFLTNDCVTLPQSILSGDKPLFHESYKRKLRIKRVFVLTSACNLQCAYCFEGTHTNSQVMSANDVKIGIEAMFQEAMEKNISIISFSLFGGEPTMNWNAVETAISISTYLEELTGIRCYKAIVTNGVMSKTQAEYLSKNMDFIYFSFDGPEELFLLQRKPKGGNEVYNTIFKNANIVYNNGKYLSFKVTVSKLTIDYLKEVDDFFAYNFPMCSRMYQPCMVDVNDPLYISFGDFLEKYNELKTYSIFPNNITTPLHKNIPSDRFCNLAIRNVIYPDRKVLACHRSNMCIPDDKVKQTFIVGNYDENGNIIKDAKMQERLKMFTVENISECNQCPFKYHCCGGCPTIKLLSGDNNIFRRADYCEDYMRFFFTDLLRRLKILEEEYIVKLPISINVGNNQIEWDTFMNSTIKRIISMEDMYE